jgi:hypothetical protein
LYWAISLDVFFTVSVILDDETFEPFGNCQYLKGWDFEDTGVSVNVKDRPERTRLAHASVEHVPSDEVTLPHGTRLVALFEGAITMVKVTTPAGRVEADAVERAPPKTKLKTKDPTRMRSSRNTISCL